jgi:serine/threonine protein kinase
MHDLSLLIAYRPLRLLNDGRNSTFLVEVIEAGSSSLRRKALSVLKIHQASGNRGSFSDVSHQQESAANSLLSMYNNASLVTAAAACKAIFARPRRRSINTRYPRCFGSVQISVELLWAAMKSRGWVGPGAENENLCHALLFEYIPNLELLMPKDVTPAIAAETHRVLKTIHARNVCHNDLQNFRIRPEVGFCNIFIQQHSRDVYILDFDAAKIVDSTLEGQRLLEEETDKLNRVFQLILSGENPRNAIPREILWLMA